MFTPTPTTNGFFGGGLPSSSSSPPSVPAVTLTSQLVPYASANIDQGYQAYLARQASLALETELNAYKNSLIHRLISEIELAGKSDTKTDSNADGAAARKMCELLSWCEVQYPSLSAAFISAKIIFLKIQTTAEQEHLLKLTRINAEHEEAAKENAKKAKEAKKKGTKRVNADDSPSSSSSSSVPDMSGPAPMVPLNGSAESAGIGKRAKKVKVTKYNFGCTIKGEFIPAHEAGGQRSTMAIQVVDTSTDKASLGPLLGLKIYSSTTVDKVVTLDEKSAIEVKLVDGKAVLLGQSLLTLNTFSDPHIYVFAKKGPVATYPLVIKKIGTLVGLLDRIWMSEKMIVSVEEGSDAIAMPAPQFKAYLAPLLSLVPSMPAVKFSAGKGQESLGQRQKDEIVKTFVDTAVAKFTSPPTPSTLPALETDSSTSSSSSSSPPSSSLSSLLV